MRELGGKMRELGRKDEEGGREFRFSYLTDFGHSLVEHPSYNCPHFKRKREMSWWEV